MSSACGITEEQAARCLNDLRQLEPYGIFAEDLKHCLLKQIQVLGMEDTDLWQVVDGYLEAVAGGKISEILPRTGPDHGKGPQVHQPDRRAEPQTAGGIWDGERLLHRAPTSFSTGRTGSGTGS